MISPLVAWKSSCALADEAVSNKDGYDGDLATPDEANMHGMIEGTYCTLLMKSPQGFQDEVARGTLFPHKTQLH